jgi:hypothetical protein
VARGCVLDGGGAQVPVCAIGHAVEQYGAHAGKDVGVLGDVAIGGKGRQCRGSRIAAVLVDLDERILIGERLLAEQRGVDQTERRGVGADAECEDQNRGQRETPVVCEPAGGVPDVALQVVEGLDGGLRGSRRRPRARGSLSAA